MAKGHYIFSSFLTCDRSHCIKAIFSPASRPGLAPETSPAPTTLHPLPGEGFALHPRETKGGGRLPVGNSLGGITATAVKRMGRCTSGQKRKRGTAGDRLVSGLHPSPRGPRAGGLPDFLRPASRLQSAAEGQGACPAAALTGEALLLPPTARGEARRRARALAFRLRATARGAPPTRLGPPPALSVSVRESQSTSTEGQRRSRGRPSQSPSLPRQHPFRCLRGFGCYRVDRVRGVYKGWISVWGSDWC